MVQRDPAGSNRTAGEQAGFQMAMVATTLGIAISSGYLTGLLVRTRWFETPKNMFADSEYFHVDEEHDATTAEVLMEERKHMAADKAAHAHAHPVPALQPAGEQLMSMTRRTISTPV